MFNFLTMVFKAAGMFLRNRDVVMVVASREKNGVHCYQLNNGEWSYPFLVATTTNLLSRYREVSDTSLRYTQEEKEYMKSVEESMQREGVDNM